MKWFNDTAARTWHTQKTTIKKNTNMRLRQWAQLSVGRSVYVASSLVRSHSSALSLMCWFNWNYSETQTNNPHHITTKFCFKEFYWKSMNTCNFLDTNDDRHVVSYQLLVSNSFCFFYFVSCVSSSMMILMILFYSMMRCSSSTIDLVGSYMVRAYSLISNWMCEARQNEQTLNWAGRT